MLLQKQNNLRKKITPSFHNLKICPLLAVRKAAGQRHMCIGFPFQTWKLRLAFMQSVAPYLISPARILSFASTSVHSSHRRWSLCVWCIFLFSAKTMGVLGGGGPAIDWNSLTEPSDSPPNTPHRDQRAAVDLQQECFPSRFHHCVVRDAGVQL